MRRIKIFKGVESELQPLEAEINTWLEDSKAEIVSVTGNIAPQTATAGGNSGTFSTSDVLVIVVYESRNVGT